MTLGFLREPGDIVTEILMTRQTGASSIVLLEGPTDRKLWSAFVDATVCELIATGGKQTLLHALRRVAIQNIPGCTGIVDDDHDTLQSIVHAIVGLHTTDCCDIEMVLIKTPALDRVLHEFADPPKLQRFTSVSTSSIRDALLQRASIFGALRLMARQEQWSVSLKNITPARFVSESTWTVDSHGIEQAILPLIPNYTLQTLRARIGVLQQLDLWKLCAGSDCLDILRIGLANTIGSNRSVGRDQLASMLRISVTRQDLKQTNVYQSIEAWSNSRWRCFPVGTQER